MAGNHETTVRPSVFVSYAHGAGKTRSKFAQLFCEELERSGLRTWLDEKDIYIDDAWDKVFEQTAKNPRTICVVLLSPDYVFSDSTIYELNLAKDLLHGFGKPILPILIEHFRNFERFIGTNVAEDFTKLYEDYCKLGENSLTPAWISKFKKSMKHVSESIIKQFDLYYNSLYVFRVQNPRHPILKQSFDLYVAFPEEYRDTPEKIERWLYETFENDPTEYHSEELYLVASYRCEIIGILYATLYKPFRHFESFCHVNMMTVLESMISFEILSPDREKYIVVTAEKLIDKLKEEVESELKKEHCQCEHYILELPVLSKADDLKAASKCWEAWFSIRPEYDKFVLMQIKDFTLKIPDTSWEVFTKKQASTQPGRLVLLRRKDQRLYVNGGKLRDLLFGLYMVYYGECYYNPFSLKDWLDYLDSLLKDTTLGLKGKSKVHLENIKR